MENHYIDKDGNKFYFNKERLHRENGPAIEWSSGTKEWYINGNLHRKDGPAVVYNSGVMWWYVNGKRHRIDGPAIEWRDGYKVWYYNNVCIGDSNHGFTQEKFERYLRELKIKEYW